VSALADGIDAQIDIVVPDWLQSLETVHWSYVED
jgi:hypothetical protein